MVELDILEGITILAQYTSGQVSVVPRPLQYLCKQIINKYNISNIKLYWLYRNILILYINALSFLKLGSILPNVLAYIVVKQCLGPPEP